MRQSGGLRYERRSQSGRFIEFNFRPIPDGGMLAIYRDITTLKEQQAEVEMARARPRPRKPCSMMPWAA